MMVTWPYASAGEVAISDPRVFPTLYFIKGSLALHALRLQIGDEQFFAGFKRLFRVGTTEPVTLDYCREYFEAAHGGSLLDFFQRLYNEPGLPDEPSQVHSLPSVSNVRSLVRNAG
jgi:aminopeptidase N